jgi:hypothetical protein
MACCSHRPAAGWREAKIFARLELYDAELSDVNQKLDQVDAELFGTMQLAPKRLELLEKKWQDLLERAQSLNEQRKITLAKLESGAMARYLCSFAAVFALIEVRLAWPVHANCGVHTLPDACLFLFVFPVRYRQRRLCNS